MDSSLRRVTRSQTAGSNSKNCAISRFDDCLLFEDAAKLIEDSEQIHSRSRRGKSTKHQLQQQQDNNRSSPLLDITNNSPIVGLAMGSLLTPSSSMAKKRSERRKPMTPGSGEALLRGQVKTLLQKVEEEAEISKISLKNRPIFPYDQGFVSSPMGLLLAPTPANTPQVLSLSGAESETNSVNSVVSSLNPDKRVSIPQVVEEILDGRMPEESTESQKSLITRSLLLDFSEKSEISSQCSSALTQTEGDNGDSKEKFSADEENSSIWSIQVNASSRDEDFEEAEVDDEFEEDNYEEEYSGEGEEEEEDEGHGESLEELCLGLGSMSILEAKFEGKHTRFVYNSDDEMVEGVGEGDLVSPGIVRLKGMPTPKGKHLRFPAVEDEDKKEAC